ncbi:MAG: serine hydrolase [Fusicatenibacter sp.]|nr:serine hydrolase [Fusicatenibacter sp.]
MKSIERMTKQNQKAVTKKKRKDPLNRVLNMLLGFVLFCVLLVGTLIGVKEYRDERKMDLSFAFSRDSLLKRDPLDLSSVSLADSFAKGLCVSEASVAYADLQVGSSEKAGLFDLDDKSTLFAQGVYDRVYPASITKIMTAMLALEYNHPDELVTILEEDLALEEGSQMSGMKAGDTVTMDQLFHTLMVYSANDAAMAIARVVGGSVDQFVQMMNDKALSLGMTGTHFVNPHGLHDENHYTTAYDVYLMLNAAFRDPQFQAVMGMPSYSLSVTHEDQSTSPIYLTSTDKYLTGEKSVPEGVIVLGGKTGTTSQAGACLAIASQNAYGEPFISVILNAKTKEALYGDMSLLLSKIND